MKLKKKKKRIKNIQKYGRLCLLVFVYGATARPSIATELYLFMALSKAQYAGQLSHGNGPVDPCACTRLIVPNYEYASTFTHSYIEDTKGRIIIIMKE